MANFKTHITVASLLSGALAASLYGVGRVAPAEVWSLWVLGSIGGILPDLDSDQSRPSQLLFASLGVLGGFLALFAFSAGRSILEMLLLLLGVFLLVRYLLGHLFARWTTHRGIFHSLLAAGSFGLLTAALAHHAFGREAAHAWLCGAFLAFGYSLHLVLDELYAVDLSDRTLRRKRSLGSAIKPFALGNWRASVAMACCAAIAFLATPKADRFLQVYGNSALYSDIYRRFWPAEGWPLFARFGDPLAQGNAPSGKSEAATGRRR